MRAAAPREVVLAGTAGGVGTTTATALLFHGFGGLAAPLLRDHAGGELGRRLVGGDDVSGLDESVVLHDLGPHAFGSGVGALQHPQCLVIGVTAATPHGLRLAEELLSGIRERHGQPGLSRSLVVAVGVHGPHRVRRLAEEFKNEFGQRSLVLIPRDPALAVGGRIPWTRLSPATRRGATAMFGQVRERLAMRRG